MLVTNVDDGEKFGAVKSKKGKLLSIVEKGIKETHQLMLEYTVQ